LVINNPTRPPYLKYVATLPRNLSLMASSANIKGTLHSVEKNPYTEGLLCLLLHSEGAAIFFMSINSVVDFSLNFK